MLVFIVPVIQTRWCDASTLISSILFVLDFN